MDLIADFADPLPSHIIATMLGLPPEDHHQFKAWTDDIYGFIGISAVPVGERALESLGQCRSPAELPGQSVCLHPSESA